MTARATRDLDGMIKGDIEEFLKAFDATLDDWEERNENFQYASFHILIGNRTTTRLLQLLLYL